MSIPLRKGYAGYALNDFERARLLKIFHPKYENVIAHHVTLAFGVDATYEIPPIDSAHVVGVADDGYGVQALVVEINGTYDRPDKSKFHITWSLAENRKPVESNDVVKVWPLPFRLGDGQFFHHAILYDPVRIRLQPKFFPFSS
jgi:hypothetical protein